jgi:hypothetical protein
MLPGRANYYSVDMGRLRKRDRLCNLLGKVVFGELDSGAAAVYHSQNMIGAPELTRRCRV